MRDISRKCSLVNTPTAGTPLVLRAMLKHEKAEGEEVKNLTTLLVKRFDVFQRFPTLRADGDCMDDDAIRVWIQLKGMTFMSLLTPGRALTLFPRCLGSLKAIHRGRATAVAAVLVQLGLKFGNLSLQASILSTEFCDEALEITDDCKKIRDVLNSVLGERSILNTSFRIWVFSSHYILF
jgi:hypothetical protein